ncbi:MAG TPA: hypothetical protein DCO77_03410 [Nitrospiraceae bacterium]|nr:hypothetical protein [Nitrospiraceae bacterium]
MNGEREQLHRLLDGELSASEAKEIIERVRSDPRLEEELLELHEAVRMVETSERLSPPPTFTAEVMRRLPERSIPLRESVRRFFFGQRVFRWNVATAMLLMLFALTASLFVVKWGDQSMVAQTTAEKPAVLVRFNLHAPGAQRVALAGDFNRWMVSEVLLTRQESGDWSVEIPLAPGMYTYMFVVDGQQWVPDPDADAYSDDGFGYKNSIRRVYHF